MIIALAASHYVITTIGFSVSTLVVKVFSHGHVTCLCHRLMSAYVSSGIARLTKLTKLTKLSHHSHGGQLSCLCQLGHYPADQSSLLIIGLFYAVRMTLCRTAFTHPGTRHPRACSAQPGDASPLSHLTDPYRSIYT